MSRSLVNKDRTYITNLFREPKSIISYEKPNEVTMKKNEDLMDFLQNVEEYSTIR